MLVADSIRIQISLEHKSTLGLLTNHPIKYEFTEFKVLLLGFTFFKEIIHASRFRIASLSRNDLTGLSNGMPVLE
jgi:hypothetical protein